MNHFDLWLKIAKFLPKKLVYACGIWMVCIATSGEYSNTDVPALTAMEAVNRYRIINGVE